MKYRVFTKVGENRLVLIGSAEENENGKGEIAVKLDALPVMGELLLQATVEKEALLVVHEIAGVKVRNLTKTTDMYGQADYTCQVWWQDKWQDAYSLTVTGNVFVVGSYGYKMPFGRLTLKEVWDKQEAARGA